MCVGGGGGGGEEREYRSRSLRLFWKRKTDCLREEERFCGRATNEQFV